LTEPFGYEFMRQALAAGVLAAVVCAVAGSWVVVRGLSFIGDALAHGVVPGVAIAFQLGASLVLGAVLSAAVMALGITVVSRRRRVGDDTAIGLLFVGMLAAGVMVLSRSTTYAGDLTSLLFGNPLGIAAGDLWLLGGATALAVALAVAFHRSLLALAFNPRKAQALGLRPRLAHAVLLGLVTIAVVASFQAIGTLMVFGLLVAPAAAASLLTRTMPSMMASAAAIGSGATVVGLLVSYHADLAAGASIAATAVAAFFVVFAGREALDALTRRTAPT
jgi:manganese/iron transport system permease protein